MDENTRAKFEEKIKELLNMAKKKKNVLEYQEISDFFADMPLEEEQFERILDALEQNNVDVLRITEDETDVEEIILSDEDEVDVALELVKEKRLRGIIFLGGYFLHSEEKIANLTVPYIFSTIGTLVPEKLNRAGYSSVAVDDRKESCAMTSYLIGLGHKDIGITLNTYGHLYPNEQKKLAEMLNEQREKKNTSDKK